MAVSNLTNTKWLIKSWPSITTATDTTYNVQFKSNNIDYTTLRLRNNNGYNYIYYNSTFVFDSDLGSWNDDAYRTIQITGGTDVTNANLITWLEANATQQVETNPLVETTISVGNKQLYNAYLGQGALQKIYKGTSLIFNRLDANFETSDHNLLITSNGDIFNVQDNSRSVTLTGTSLGLDSQTKYYIKVGSSPSSDNDYTYCIEGGWNDENYTVYDSSRHELSYQEPYLFNVQNNDTLYIWGYCWKSGMIKMNDQSVSSSYNAPTTVTINSDTVLNFAIWGGR